MNIITSKKTKHYDIIIIGSGVVWCGVVSV